MAHFVLRIFQSGAKSLSEQCDHSATHVGPVAWVALAFSIQK